PSARSRAACPARCWRCRSNASSWGSRRSGWPAATPWPTRRPWTTSPVWPGRAPTGSRPRGRAGAETSRPGAEGPVPLAEADTRPPSLVPVSHQQPAARHPRLPVPWPEPGRLVGVDVARALAVFGMFAVHLGVTSLGALDGPVAETAHELMRGRSSALFAFLAGVSLSLLSGRQTPLHGEPLHRVRVKILVRAALLAVIGVFADLLDTSVAIILVYYAGYFLLALPLLRLGAAALAAVAAGVA